MLELRPYQNAAVEAIYRHLRQRDDNPCVVIPTGGGKTLILATVCQDAVGQWGGRVLILAHVKELLEQAREKLHVVAPEMWMKTGVYSAGLKSRDTDKPIIIAGIQSVFRRACELDAFDLVIIDECFVAGTLIRTPSGDVPIEQLHVGQSICTAVGVGKIEVISARRAEQLIEVETDDGTTITCTPEHPFFTEDGWVDASSLAIGARLFREEDLRLLRSRIRTLDQTQSGRSGDQLHAGTAVGKAEVLLEILLKEVREPNEMCDLAGQDAPVALEATASADQAGRQRQAAANPAASVAARTRSGMASRACSDDGSAATPRHSQALQAGPCASAGPDCAGVGRRQSSVARDSLGRHEEDPVLGGARVVRVTALEQHGSVPVFNLHIREHPSYYAGGLLVHNCHMIPPDGEGMYRKFLNDARTVNPNLRVIGLTATPFRMKSGMICGPQNVLNEVCYEIGVKELIVQGYLCPLITKGSQRSVDTSGLHVRAGEFIAGEAEDLMNTDELVETACAEIIEQTRQRHSVLVFTTGVKHARSIAAALRKMSGSEVGTVFGSTSNEDRDRVLADFKAGKLKFLVNVNVLTMGFDAPNIDCVAMVRPTMSPGLYYQMVGRGFRLFEGKENCLVLDFGGNVLRHGPVDAIRVREPLRRGNGEAPAKQCPECQSVIAAGYTVCPDCGFEFPPPERSQHEATASTEGILSGEVSTSEHLVEDVFYSVHHKKDAPEEAPKTLRVEYRIGFHQYQSEWICFEHTGWARKKAESWWRKRSNAPVPWSVAEAVEMAYDGAVCDTYRITMRKVVGEKYPKIIGYELGEKPVWREPGMDDDEVMVPSGSFAPVDLDDIPF